MNRPKKPTKKNQIDMPITRDFLLNMGATEEEAEEVIERILQESEGLTRELDSRRLVQIFPLGQSVISVVSPLQ